MERPRVSVVIPVYNRVDLLERCLAALDAQTERRIEVIVVDDASPEDPAAVLERHPSARVIRLPANAGYAEANNRGLAAACGSLLLLLNSDVEIPPNGIERLAACLEATPEAAAAAPLHRDPRGALQRTCFRLPTRRTGWLWDSALHRLRPQHPVLRDYLIAEWSHDTDRWVESAQTSCLMLRRAVYEAIGGMDPQLRLFYNDVDFCARMRRAGFRIRFTAAAEVAHHGGASVRTFEQAEQQVYGDRYRYYRKWFGRRGALSVRAALWSRVACEALAALATGHVRSAARNVRRGLRLSAGFRAPRVAAGKG
jgi:hypothetical protein